MQANQQSFFETFEQIDFEQIQKHPNILIAARFWDDERYQAARTCYKFMRAIDDFIDDHKALHRIIRKDRQNYFMRRVSSWLESVRDRQHEHPLNGELVACIDRFHIPLWPMEDFANAMIYDIHHNGFATFNHFKEYSGGASVAPSSIFVHLCGLTRNDKGWQAPAFDVREAALPCAMFSYLVHIIRDFEKDQRENLHYFADDRILAHGLSRQALRDIALGAPVSKGFRALIREYMDIAEGYRLETLKVIERISPYLEPRNQLSLQIIYNLYLMVYERIDPENGSFTSAALNPTAGEIRERVLGVLEMAPCGR